jgi:hypothetical protein
MFFLPYLKEDVGHLEAINSHASVPCKNNTSRRELLVGRRELLQVSVEKGETQVGGEEERSLRGSGVHQGAKASARAQWCRGQCQGTLVTLEC